MENDAETRTALADQGGRIVAEGIDISPVHEVLVEESLLGWKEYEMEVVRDKNDNCIIICSIENVDPMGVHTGDSITVAPALTLTDKEYQVMRNASIAVLREIGVIRIAKEDLPCFWLIEAAKQIHNSRFARTRMPHQRDCLALELAFRVHERALQDECVFVAAHKLLCLLLRLIDRQIG